MQSSWNYDFAALTFMQGQANKTKGGGLAPFSQTVGSLLSTP